MIIKWRLEMISVMGSLAGTFAVHEGAQRIISVDLKIPVNHSSPLQIMLNLLSLMKSPNKPERQ